MKPPSKREPLLHLYRKDGKWVATLKKYTGDGKTARGALKDMLEEMRLDLLERIPANPKTSIYLEL